MANKKYKKIGIYDSCVNSYIFELVGERSKCLDVGCWTGNLGKKLIREKSCRVDGIDFNKDALLIAKSRGYNKIFNINLICSPNEIDSVKEKYDYIVCADVLEHLTSPFEVLLSLKKRLKINGALIISTPNIAFAKQRMDLFLGRFDYNPNGGIMDETHLHFFTSKTIQSICSRAGFQIESFSGYSLVKNKYFFLRYLARIWPSLFAIQFLLKIRRKNISGL